MKRYIDQLIFGANVLCALLCLGLIALNVVQAEAALTRGEMLPLNVTATVLLVR
jgi:hypothetical protein